MDTRSRSAPRDRSRRLAEEEAVAGRAALRQGRAGAPSAVRRRHDPGCRGIGTDLKVTVEFDDRRSETKQLLVAYAGLEREWESA